MNILGFNKITLHAGLQHVKGSRRLDYGRVSYNRTFCQTKEPRVAL